MDTKFVLRRSIVVVLAFAFALGSSAVSSNAFAAGGVLERGRVVTHATAHATIALVIAATSWIPGAIGAPTTVPWFTRLDPHVLVFGVDVMGVTRRVTS